MQFALTRFSVLGLMLSFLVLLGCSPSDPGQSVAAGSLSPKLVHHAVLQTEADPEPVMNTTDKERLVEALRLCQEVGPKLWEGWNEAPYALLLVTDSFEYLIHHSNPSDDFEHLGYDEDLKSELYVRPAQFSKQLLATFPAVNGVSTIVVGTAENTGRSPIEWMLTLSHEHFHQLQTSSPGYYQAVNALELAKGDTTGMWMLNYPFPYKQKLVDSLFGVMSKHLLAMLNEGTPTETALQNYLALKKVFRASISEADYRYFHFQLWQEGLARYAELHMAREGAANFDLARYGNADHGSLEGLYQGMLERIKTQLEKGELKKQQRVAFYAFGAAEGLILDSLRPGWRDQYFTHPFGTDAYFEMPADR